jgi:chaperonin cofactor prefoldin
MSLPSFVDGVMLSNDLKPKDTVLKLRVDTLEAQLSQLTETVSQLQAGLSDISNLLAQLITGPVINDFSLIP